MDLTAGVSSALLSSGLLPLDSNHTDIECDSNTLFDEIKKALPNENIYEELRTPRSTIDKNDMQQMLANINKTKVSNHGTFRTSSKKLKGTNPITHAKFTLKKGVSEPNLAKTKSLSSTFFSPRNLLDRFKRMLPLSSSKQSLNDKPMDIINGATIESDDSTSISSENNDDIRTSRLDHVSRVKNVYDTLGMLNNFYPQ